MMDRAQLAAARVFEGDANRDESAGDGLDKLRTHPVVLAWLEMDVPAMVIWLGGGGCGCVHVECIVSFGVECEGVMPS